MELFIDSASIGKSPLRPYKQSFDAATLSLGEHVVKAVGRDQSGKEVWTASTAIKTGEPREPEKLRDSTVLENNFTSREHGFSIRYPAGWTYKDQTAKMKPKLRNGLVLKFL